MDKKKLRGAPLLVVAAAALCVMLGACGSGSGGSSSDPSSQPGAGSPSGTAQAGQAQFAQCMRQNGVTNFPDPQNGHFVIPSGAQSNPHFQSAIQTCQHLLGPGGASNNTNPAQQQARLAFAQCMQTHGVPNFPEPPANGAIVVPSGMNTNSPTYQRAFSECRSKLPGNGQGLQAS